MNGVDLTTFKTLFLKTARENIEDLFAGASTLLVTPFPREVIQKAYIAGHSLKSKCQTMGYQNMAILSASFESIFRRLHENGSGHSPTPEEIAILQNAVEMCRRCIANIETNDAEIDLQDTIKALETLVF